MLSNRSAPPATVTPVLVYDDVRAAVAWLESAFAFGERVRIGDTHRAQCASAQMVLSLWPMRVPTGLRQAAAV